MDLLFLSVIITIARECIIPNHPLRSLYVFKQRANVLPTGVIKLNVNEWALVHFVFSLVGLIGHKSLYQENIYLSGDPKQWRQQIVGQAAGGKIGRGDSKLQGRQQRY